MKKKFEKIFSKGTETGTDAQTITIQFKKTKQLEKEQNKNSGVLSASSTVTEEIEPESAKKSRYKIMQSFWNRCINLANILTTIIGTIGGIHSIYQIINTYIIQQEERMEVVVIRRS